MKSIRTISPPSANSNAPDAIITIKLPTEAWVPHGYEKIRDTVRRLYVALGGENQALLGPTIVDERRYTRAVETIWAAVDRGQLTLFIFDGAGPAALSADVSRAVPFLRRPRVLSLVFLRAAHPLHTYFVENFGIGFPRLALGFNSSDVDKLARQTLRANQSDASAHSGRPRIGGVHEAVQRVIENGKWKSSDTLEKLTEFVNKEMPAPVTPDTVARRLEGIFHETGNPLFRRTRRKRF